MDGQSALLPPLPAETPDHDALLGQMRRLAASGHIQEAVQCLVRARPLYDDLSVMMRDVHHLAAEALQHYNQHLQAGNLPEAASYLASLVELAPGNIHFVQLALTTQQQLGNPSQIAVYAKHLLVLDDTNS
jgi:hypothetical protein